MKRQRSWTPTDALAFAEAPPPMSLCDLPNELLTHIVNFLVPAQASTLSETCRHIHSLYYETRRAIRYTVDFSNPSIKDDELARLLRDKLNRFNSHHIHTLELRLRGRKATKYSFSLPDIAPHATKVILDFPRSRGMSGFKDVADLTQIQSLHLRYGALDLFPIIKKLPRLKELRLYTELWNLRAIHELFQYSKAKIILDIRNIDVWITSVCPRACLIELFTRLFPNARIHVCVIVPSHSFFGRYGHTVELAFKYAHALHIQFDTPTVIDPAYYRDARWVVNPSLKEIHTSFSVDENIRSLLRLGAPRLVVTSQNPSLTIKAIRATCLSYPPNNSRQTSEVHILNSNRPQDPPVVLKATEDYTCLPQRRPPAIIT